MGQAGHMQACSGVQAEGGLVASTSSSGCAGTWPGTASNVCGQNLVRPYLVQIRQRGTAIAWQSCAAVARREPTHQ